MYIDFFEVDSNLHHTVPREKFMIFNYGTYLTNLNRVWCRLVDSPRFPVDFTMTPWNFRKFPIILPWPNSLVNPGFILKFWQTLSNSNDFYYKWVKNLCFGERFIASCEVSKTQISQGAVSQWYITFGTPQNNWQTISKKFEVSYQKKKKKNGRYC